MYILITDGTHFGLLLFRNDPMPEACPGKTSTQIDYCVPASGGDDTQYDAYDPVDTVDVDGQDDTQYDPWSDTKISEPFRLKMYWEEGYMWQDETFERKCKWKTLFYFCKLK